MSREQLISAEAERYGRSVEEQEQYGDKGNAASAEYVLPLDRVDKEDLELVGGKAANLGEMIKKGLPVPGGFVLTTHAYRRFVEANGLEERIETLLQPVQASGAEDYQELEQVSRRIRDLFAHGTIPEDLRTRVDQVYRESGQGQVVVRSSATAEDLPGTSFAGQYDTYLNVQGTEHLNQSIQKCWASLWNDRALSYRLHHGIDSQGLAHGVVVQEQVNAERSGILFTANPVNGRGDQMLLNSSWGLGEAVVSGEVTPDQWIMDRSAGSITKEQVACKEVMTVRGQSGVYLEAVAPELQEETTLTREQVLELLDLGERVEEYFGSPQDVEWAEAGGRFYLVQTRPITSLYPVPESAKEGLRIYCNMNIASQQMAEPFTPMGEEVFRIMLSGMVEQVTGKRREASPWWYHSLGGQVFIDMTELLKSPRLRPKVYEALGKKSPMTVSALDQAVEEYADDLSGPGARVPLRALGQLPSLGGAILVGKISPQKGRRQAAALGENLLARLEREEAAIQGVEEALEFIDTYASGSFMGLWQQFMYCAPALEGIDQAEQLLQEWLGDAGELEAVRRGLPGSPTTEMGRDLVQAALDLQKRGGAVEIEAPEIQAFLHKYGHRSTVEVDVGTPPWSEDPGYILNLVQSYLNQGDLEQLLDKFRQDQEDGDRAIEEITARVAAEKSPAQARRIRKLLQDYRSVAGVRELPKFNLTQAFAIFRRVLWQAGEALVQEGRLQQAEDIFFLRFRDLEREEDLTAAAAANRERYQQELQRRQAPLVLVSNGHSIYHASPPETDNALAGIPVSPGSSQGKARIVVDPSEADLEPGDVLVAKGTNPAWTPLFLTAGALVMETGGPISHGSIVAREYGIPAVVGVRQATSRIREGQTVRVNGESGQVELLD